MGGLFSTDSTHPEQSTARYFEGIKLLFSDPVKEFPQDFDPERPFKTRSLLKVSRASFVSIVNGSDVVLLENFGDFEPQSPLEVELRDNATYIVVSPKVYNVNLIWGKPDQNFADFDYNDPFRATVIAGTREGFISMVEAEGCATVLPLEDFLNFKNRTAFILRERSPREVELRDNATFILIPAGEGTLFKMVRSLARRVLLSLVEFFRSPLIGFC